MDCCSSVGVDDDDVVEIIAVVTINTEQNTYFSYITKTIIALKYINVLFQYLSRTSKLSQTLRPVEHLSVCLRFLTQMFKNKNQHKLWKGRIKTHHRLTV